MTDGNDSSGSVELMQGKESGGLIAGVYEMQRSLYLREAKRSLNNGS
jgi:hypothetical protein